MTGPTRAAGRHVPYVILLIAGAAFLVAEALLNHRALGTGYDLGIYDQVVWNMAHGRPFATTLVYETNGYYDHFEPVLALIAPLYWLWSDVRVLLLVQATALALGSLPIYLYARHWLLGFGPKFALLALLPVVAYLLYPPLHSANLNDFHKVGLLPPLIGSAVYGLLTRRRAWLAGEVIVAADREAAWRHLTAADFDPARQVVLPTLPTRFTPDPACAGQITWQERAPERLVLSVTTAAPCVLVLSELDYPGWQATVDGVAAPILQADVILRALALAPGQHEIRLVYRPASVLWGGLISLATVIAALAWLAVGRRTRWQ